MWRSWSLLNPHLSLLLFIPSEELSDLIHDSRALLAAAQPEGWLGRACGRHSECLLRWVRKSRWGGDLLEVLLCTIRAALWAAAAAVLLDGLKLVRLRGAVLEGVVLAARGISRKEADQVWAGLWGVGVGCARLLPAAVIYCGVHGVGHRWTLAGAAIVLVEVRLPLSCTETSGVIWRWTVRSLSSPTQPTSAIQVHTNNSLHYQHFSLRNDPTNKHEPMSSSYDRVFLLGHKNLTDVEIHTFQSCASSGGRQVWTQWKRDKAVTVPHNTRESELQCSSQSFFVSSQSYCRRTKETVWLE